MENMANFTKEDVLNDINELSNSLDYCIDSLVNARLQRNKMMEAHARWAMESLLVSALQEFEFLKDYINKKIND